MACPPRRGTRSWPWTCNEALDPVPRCIDSGSLAIAIVRLRQRACAIPSPHRQLHTVDIGRGAVPIAGTELIAVHMVQVHRSMLHR